MELSDMLARRKACRTAQVWAKGRETEAAYAECPYGDWLLWVLLQLGADATELGNIRSWYTCRAFASAARACATAGLNAHADALLEESQTVHPRREIARAAANAADAACNAHTADTAKARAAYYSADAAYYTVDAATAPEAAYSTADAAYSAADTARKAAHTAELRAIADEVRRRWPWARVAALMKGIDI